MSNGSPTDDSAALRKRRQRSQSSPELFQSPGTDYFALSSLHGPPAGSSTPHPDGNGAPESTSAVRRREANRLAAQRFRSRKKGYQDSLEERIKVLEDERDALLRRMGEMPEGANHTPVDARDATDTDVRIASLEAANRRLRDEIRGVYEENDRLREDLDGWRRWHHERPRGLPALDLNLPPLHPQLERTRSFQRPSSSELVLPPLRLPPLSPAISDTRSQNTPVPPLAAPYPLQSPHPSSDSFPQNILVRPVQE